MFPARSQGGAALFVVLIMLVVLTLFVVTGVNLTSTNLKVVGNMQAQQFIESTVDQALSQTLSDPVNFTSPAAKTVVVQGVNVAVARPVCNNATPDTETEATKKLGLPPDEYTTWDLQASGTDDLTGARVTIHQGVAIRLPQGSCPGI